jgi:hypothetical protein
MSSNYPAAEDSRDRLRRVRSLLPGKGSSGNDRPDQGR